MAFGSLKCRRARRRRRGTRVAEVDHPARVLPHAARRLLVLVRLNLPRVGLWLLRIRSSLRDR